MADFGDEHEGLPVSQVVQDPLDAARAALERHDWVEGYELLRAADETMELAPEDLMLLGEAAMWNGEMEMVHPYFERAYRGYHAWQVFYKTTGGDLLLPVGYGH